MARITRREFLTGAASAAMMLGGPLAFGDAPKSPPNILVLFSDQHNGAVLGCMGHPDVLTPHLDHFASEGVLFRRAYCQDGVCVPSRSSFLTGQYCRTLGVLDNAGRPPGLERFPTIQMILKEHGYRTAAFGKRHLPPGLDVGWDVTCTTLPMKNEPSDESYRDWIVAQGQGAEFDRDWQAETGGAGKAAPMACLVSRLKPENTMEAYTAARTIDFLRSVRAHKKPFFCWTSFYRPHQPYTPLPEFVRMYPMGRLQLPSTLKEPPDRLPPALRNLRRNRRNPWCLGWADEGLYRRYLAYYYALVTEIDYHIGRILAVLEQEGLAENTLVVYTSDHGDFVGAHGMVEKCAAGHNVYEDTLHVPLILRWPRGQRGGIRDDLVELVDLFPTFLEAAGIAAPSGHRPPGRSLLPVVEKGKPLGRRIAVSENRKQITAIGERYKLGMWLERPEGGYPDMLFDRKSDPAEAVNLIGRPEVRAVESALRGFLAEWIRRTPTSPG